MVSLAGQVVDISWSPNGKRIAVGDGNGYAIILDALTGTQVARYPVSKGWMVAVSWSPDGKSLLSVVYGNPQPYILPAWQTTEEADRLRQGVLRLARADC